MYTTSTIFAPIYTIFKEGARAKKKTQFFGQNCSKSAYFVPFLVCFGLFKINLAD